MSRATSPAPPLPDACYELPYYFTLEEMAWIGEMMRAGHFLTTQEVLCQALYMLGEHFDLKMPLDAFSTPRGPAVPGGPAQTHYTRPKPRPGME